MEEILNKSTICTQIRHQDTEKNQKKLASMTGCTILIFSQSQALFEYNLSCDPKLQLNHSDFLPTTTTQFSYI